MKDSAPSLSVQIIFDDSLTNLGCLSQHTIFSCNSKRNRLRPRPSAATYKLMKSYWNYFCLFCFTCRVVGEINWGDRSNVTHETRRRILVWKLRLQQKLVDEGWTQTSNVSTGRCLMMSQVKKQGDDITNPICFSKVNSLDGLWSTIWYAYLLQEAPLSNQL